MIVPLVPSTRWMHHNIGMKLSNNEDRIKVASSLVHHKSDPFIKNSYGKAPMLLELACKCESLEDVCYFIDTAHVNAEILCLESVLCVA